MTLNEMFDHIYCINLDSRQDRWEECQAEFNKHNILNVEKFSATSAEDIDFIIKDIKRGEAGLIHTHIRILNDAKEKGYNSILILEDDVEFKDTVHESLDYVPRNWEVLYFGGNHAWGQPYKINDVISVPNRTLAMHCVGLRHTMYDKMLSVIKYNMPIDATYAYNLFTMNSYVFVPPQAWQRPGWSDLMGQNVDYGFLK